MRRITTIGLFMILPIFSAQAQILDKIKKVKNTITENTIDKLSKDPVTTNFDDVDKTLHVANTFGDDSNFALLFEQSFDPENGFTLAPGFYEGTFQSFCIKAGTYQPIRGRGRFYAPIKGPKADIISAIVERYQASDEFTQREIQLLLWAIIAKTDFAKMQGPVKVTALKVLSAKEIARLSKGAIDKLARNEVKKISRQSPALRAVLEAEANLRSKYYQGVRSYQEYEAIAMRAGVEPIVPGFEAGRWTRHPDGYLIRYFPRGYSKTRTQVYVPEDIGTVQFNPSTAIAVPPNRGQRLLQTNLPVESSGGYIDNYQDPFCESVIHPAADSAVKKQMIMQNIPGLTIAVYRNGKMAHIKAYGYKDIYAKEPLTVHSKMKWASISKSVTGVAAAQLEQRNVGRFKISDKITKYVDNWEAVRYEDTAGTASGTDRRPLDITVQQLLSNAGGIQQYGKGSRKGDDEKYTLFIDGRDTLVVAFEENKDAYGADDGGPRKFKAFEAVEVFNKSVLDTIPGTKYHYSSYSFVLAGAAIDQVAPNGYVPWVKEHIKNKAGLTSMRITEDRFPGHDMALDGMLRAYNSGIRQSTIPAGGYVSNICDLAKYAYALSRGEFLDTNKDVLWNNSVSIVKDASQSKAAYSYGLNHIGSGNDLRIWHGGHGGNTRSYMAFFPSDSTGIAVMANAVYADLPELSRHVFQAMNIRPGLFNGRDHLPADNCRRDMENDEDLFHGVWRITSEADQVIVRTGFEDRGIEDEIKRLKDAGYELTDIETFTNEGKRYWDAIFKEGSESVLFIKDMPLSQLKDQIRGMNDKGYQVTDIESYTSRNGRRWTAVFTKASGRNKTLFGVPTSEFRTAHNQHTANGWQLVDIESYREGNAVLWHGVWKEGGDGILALEVTPKTLFEEVDNHYERGYRLMDVEYYLLPNQEWRAAAIWEKGRGFEYITGQVIDADQDGDDDDGDTAILQKFCDHMNAHHGTLKRYELIDWERFDVEWKD